MDRLEANPWHVLLVEDNEINREVVCQLLVTRGYRVTVARHGSEALEALGRDDSIALVFMDVEMPVMDGLQATRALRADPRWARLPVVGITAHAGRQDLSTLYEAGMDSVVVKPARLAQLEAAVRRHLAPRDPPAALPAATPQPPVTSLFERGGLLATVEWDEAFMVELLTLFLDDAPGLLADLEAAVRAGDHEVIRRSAHGVKGAAANVSAPALRQAAWLLERAAAEQSGDLEHLLSQLATCWERTRARLAEELS